jgi:hypothetical protein
MEFFTFVDLETARVVRKAYIDALISNMIRLETDPHVVVWIDRLRECRERDWNDEVRDIIRNAILTYNNRWTVIYGGGSFSKFLGKAVKGVTAGLTGESVQGSKTGNLFKALTERAMGQQKGGVVEQDEEELRTALRAELERMDSMTEMIKKHI